MEPEASTQASSSKMPPNYAFVANVARLVGVTSFALAPGHELRRATPDEIEVLRNVAARLFPGPIAPTRQYLWERQWPSQTVVMLPEEEWRYFVVAFTGSNEFVDELQTAFDIAPVELEIAFTVLCTSNPGAVPVEGVVWPGLRLFQTFQNVAFDPAFFREVSVDDLRTASDIFARLQQAPSTSLDVRRLARELSDVKTLPQRSPLRFLAYFAILESLLTHPPKPTDPYDSITRQVTRKVALLNNRWPARLDYGSFGGARHETIWAKMYAYRSSLAHGGDPDFTSELAVLGGHGQALKLIKETTKAVIRQALDEPQLLLDLREC